MAGRGRSVRSLLIAWFLLPALALFVLAGVLGARLSVGILERELGDNLSALAAATSAQLNATRVLSIEAGDDQANTRTYRNTLKTLGDVQRATAVRRVVVVDLLGRVRVDTSGELPSMTEMPELARDRLELSRVFERGERAASQVLFTGTDGQLYKTGYAPLFGEEGEVVGAVAVEARGEFWAPLQELSYAYALLTVGVLAALLGAALWMGASLSGPLRRLVAAAQGIGKGDLQTPIPPEDTQEVGTLAAELEEMRKALESRDRQLKMMLAGVAHEVRNPIGGMELFAGLLAEDLPPPSQGGEDPLADARSHVRRIQQEIDYLKRIVEDFLAFAREQELARVQFDPALLVEAACELMAADASAKRVLLVPEAQAGGGEADGDQSLLIAAVVNLVKNAVQASPEGAEVRVRGRNEEGGYRIEVEDRGPGIPQERQERIFEPFFTTREKGTGLGLPLAKKIAQAHRGELQVRSSPGETVFTLRLPLG